MEIDNTNGFGNSRNSRIVYIDPNDLYGEVNGASTTPDYTDYCLWCNLIVEKGTRLKNGATGTDKSGTTTISFTTRPQEGMQYMSFLQGADSEKYNYLTTYYADIDYNEIKSHNIVEGIGIESISISMANYYVPEVTINFVDVRGAGFFGREEATHHNGNLINLEKNSNGTEIDNLYSCFTTMPYPRFKLQVKGFYGQPVTYQLTCCNFEGSFDNNTGNFRLITKFIGHQYSILGDIPFQYIVSAPLCKFVGESYWNSHVDSVEWRLPNGQKPEKLYNVFMNIKSAIQVDENKLKSICDLPDQQAVITAYQDELTYIKLTQNSIQNFKNSLIRCFGNENVIQTDLQDDSNSSEQMLLFKSDSRFIVTEEIASAYNSMLDYIKSIVEYNECGITLDKIPNGCNPNIKWKPNVTAELTQLFTFNDNNTNIYNTDKNSTDSSFLSGYEVNALGCNNKSANVGRLEISELMSAKVSKVINSSAIKNNNKCYCILVDFNNVSILLNRRSTYIENEIKKMAEAINDVQKETMVSLIGFEPYIGSFFKVIMCHLETFVHMMYEVANGIDEDIRNNARTPAMLGVKNISEDTDLGESIIGYGNTNSINIPAWPGLFTNDSKKDDSNDIEGKKYANPDEESQVWAWIGNFKGSTRWREQDFVEQFYLALIKALNVKSDNSSTSDNYVNIHLKYPVIPSDLFNDTPFYASQTKDGLAAYLGLRAVQIFSLMNRGNKVSDSVAEKIGAVDAFNYINDIPSKSHVKNNLLVSCDGKSVENELIDIMLARDRGNGEHYNFEFTTTENGKQPIFSENSDGYKYVYMLGKDDTPIIPIASNLDSGEIKGYAKWDKGKFITKSKTESNGDEIIKFGLSGNSQHTESSDKFIRNNIDEIYSKELYENSNLCQFIEDESDVESICGIHKYVVGDGEDELSVETSKLKISDAISQSEYKNNLGRYWQSMDDFNKFYTKADQLNMDSYEDLGIDYNDINNNADLTIQKIRELLIDKM